jgi:hypothetical protein
MKKINWTPEQEAEINRVQRTTGVTRKSAIRKMRAAAKVQAKVKAQAVKTTPKPQPQQKSAGVNRSEGIRLFKVAGRPTKEQFILVYGERASEYLRSQPDPLADSMAEIIQHMNGDHKDALVQLAREFARIESQEATMTMVDHLGFQVRLKTQDGIRGARIAFLREVSNPAEARKVLVEMVQQARSEA